jgi:hypothetical protein
MYICAVQGGQQGQHAAEEAHETVSVMGDNDLYLACHGDLSERLVAANTLSQKLTQASCMTL